MKLPIEARGETRVLEVIQSYVGSSNSSKVMGEGLFSCLHPKMCLSPQSKELDHPCVFFFSLGHRLSPGCDRQLHSFFCGGWGLPSCREWSSHHSAALLLLIYLQVSGPCNRGTGYQNPFAQGRAGRGLNSKKRLSGPESQRLAAPGLLLPYPDAPRTTVP